MQCFDELHTKFCLPLIMFSSSHQSTDSFETETNILPEQKMKADYNTNNNNNFINLLKKAFQLNLQCQISKT